MQVGLIGGENINKYSIAHKVWSYIFLENASASIFSYFPISNEQEVYFILEKVRKSELAGVNIALPWKAVAAEYCDIKTPVVEMTGYSNIVYSREEKLIADNTDGLGFINALPALPKKVLIYGAGGAGAALAYELSNLNVSVTITDTDNERLQFLNQKKVIWTGGELVTTLDLNSICEFSFDVVVNATPLGKKDVISNRKTDLYLDQSPITLDRIGDFKRGTLFAEMNYHPFKTKFLNDAEASGMKIQAGIAMLFHQAARSFELYSKEKIEVPKNFEQFYMDMLSSVNH